VDDGWNAFGFIYEGNVKSGESLSKGQLAVYNTEGNIHFKTNSTQASIYLVAGEPLNEPVARGGPFVMNTRDEVLKAFEDFHKGKFES